MNRQQKIWLILAVGVTAGAFALYFLREPKPAPASSTKDSTIDIGTKTLDPSGVFLTNGKMVTSDPATISPPEEVMEAI